MVCDAMEKEKKYRRKKSGENNTKEYINCEYIKIVIWESKPEY